MPGTEPLSILSRSSPLAKIQVNEALDALRIAFPDRAFVLRDTRSLGDCDLQTPLTDPSIPSDFFTREIDDAQRAGLADLAVHSAKDLPTPLANGIALGALLPAADPRDALCLRDGLDLADLRVLGTSSLKRETELRALFPGIQCRSIRGTIEQRLAQLDAGDLDAVVIAACALDRLGLSHRIHQYLDYETTPQQGRLAITVRADRADLLAALRRIDVRRRAGLVALVGCPADPVLFPPHARNLLDAADVVFHDRLLPASVIDSLGSRAVDCGKRGHQPSITQNEIHRRILHAAEQGKLVVRLHGGEPGILGHLGETLSFCSAWNLRTEVVPAVSAAQLAAARAMASLTHRHHGRAITFLSGHAAADETPLPPPATGNIALYMGVKEFPALRQKLYQAGWPGDTEFTAAQHLGGEDETLLRSTLAQIDPAALASPAVILLGPHSHLQQGYTLFTGTDPEKFFRHGPLLHRPFISLAPLPVESVAPELRKRLSSWTGVILPSSFAVNCFLKVLLTFTDLRVLRDKQVLAVGPVTARALRDRGIVADASPPDFGGVQALVGQGPLPPGTYGYLCSDLAPLQERAQAVQSAGIHLDPLPLYQNRPVRYTRLPGLPFHRVLFTSSSTVQNYFDNFPQERDADREWIAVGSSTLHHLHHLGLHAHLLET